MKEQIAIFREADGGGYYNFFYTPGSIDSMVKLIEGGWILIFIKDDPEVPRVLAVFEREKK